MIGNSRYSVRKDPFQDLEFENSEEKIEFDDFDPIDDYSGY